MCECHQIGGPWIGADPSCPVHGTDAVARQDEEVRVLGEMEQRLIDLEMVVQRQDYTISQLEDTVAMLVRVIGDHR